MPKKSKAPGVRGRARERILQAALKLYNEHGIPNTGTEHIIAEADVAKMTFYRIFGSKSGLTKEVLKIRDEHFFEIIDGHIKRASNPKDKVLGLFDGLHEWFETPGFNGCIFLRGVFDFDGEDEDPLVKQAFQTHFKRFDRLLVSLVKPIAPQGHKKMVLQLSALVTGAIIMAQTTGSAEIAVVSKELTRKLLD